jgi:hypothetical protein
VGKRGVFPLLLATLYVVALASVVLVWLDGRSFYLAPLAERPHHPGYWRFKPGGSLGHPLGVVGSAMLLLLLLYSVRKRVRGLSRLGRLGRWLDVHIFLGSIGPLYVVLHSSFKVQGLVALSFWSMVGVALSGVLGRYLYLQIPRTRAGDELTLDQLRAEDQRLEARLRAFGLDQQRIDELGRIAAPPGNKGAPAALIALLIADLRLRSRLARFARGCATVPARELQPFVATARAKALVHRRLELWDALHGLFHHWHVLHKPFALVMYVFMLVHVGVALWTGYLWGG